MANPSIALQLPSKIIHLLNIKVSVKSNSFGHFVIAIMETRRLVFGKKSGLCFLGTFYLCQRLLRIMFGDKSTEKHNIYSINLTVDKMYLICQTMFDDKEIFNTNSVQDSINTFINRVVDLHSQENSTL